MRANAGRARFLRLFPERDLAGRGFFCNFAAAFHIASLYERDSKENIAADDGGFRNLRLRKHSFHPHPQRKRPDCHPLPPLSSRTGPSSFGQRLPVHRGRQCGDILNVASRRDELRRFRTPIYGTDRPAVREKLRCI